MKQRSELDIVYRYEAEEEQKEFVVCRRGDILDVDGIGLDVQTNVEAQPTAGGTVYLSDGGNLSGTLELQTEQQFGTPTAAFEKWLAVTAELSGMPHRGQLEISAPGLSVVYEAGISGFAPTIERLLAFRLRISFVVSNQN